MTVSIGLLSDVMRCDRTCNLHLYLQPFQTFFNLFYIRLFSVPVFSVVT